MDAGKQVLHRLIISHIDYCNSLFYGLPKNYIKKLQYVHGGQVNLAKTEICQCYSMPERATLVTSEPQKLY